MSKCPYDLLDGLDESDFGNGMPFWYCLKPDFCPSQCDLYYENLETPVLRHRDEGE